MVRPSSRHQQQEHRVEWKPRTTLGSLVASGKINSMDEVYENGMRIQESEIVVQHRELIEADQQPQRDQ